MKIRLVSLTVMFLIISINVFAQTPEEYKVKDANLNSIAAEANLKQIENALKDFRDFTELVISDEISYKLKSNGAADVKLKAKEIEKISNMNWSIQNIGFNNWILVVRGTLLKLEYLNKKREYELEKYRGQLSERDLVKLKITVDTAFKEYQEFLSKSVYAD